MKNLEIEYQLAKIEELRKEFDWLHYLAREKAEEINNAIEAADEMVDSLQEGEYVSTIRNA